MLWIAQRVVAPATGQQGINVYRYLHGLEGRRTNPQDYFALPAHLHRQTVAVPPGGNRVRSYVDVGCPDDISPDELTRSMQLFINLPAPPAQPIHFYGELCAFAFAVEGALLPSWRMEFLQLLQHMTDVERTG